MNCRDFQNLVAIGIYGRPTGEEQAELDRHRSACPECAALYEKHGPGIVLQEEAFKEALSAPLPDWDKSWAAISEKAFPQRRTRFPLLTLIPRWIPASAAILVVFVLGYLAGRRILLESITSGPGIATLSSENPSSPLAFAEYADNLKPVLISFLNRGDVPQPEELRTLEREIIRDMLSRTRVLESLAAESGDTSREGLLLDLELILMSLANLAPGDTESAVHLERMIREKDIALRLRELASRATI